MHIEILFSHHGHVLVCFTSGFKKSLFWKILQEENSGSFSVFFKNVSFLDYIQKIFHSWGIRAYKNVISKSGFF